MYLLFHFNGCCGPVDPKGSLVVVVVVVVVMVVIVVVSVIVVEVKEEKQPHFS